MAKIFLRFVGGSSARFRLTPAELEIENQTTVGELLKFLKGDEGYCPGELLSMVVIVNGRSIHTLEGYQTQLRDGDTVAILPFLAGG